MLEWYIWGVGFLCQSGISTGCCLGAEGFYATVVSIYIYLPVLY